MYIDWFTWSIWLVGFAILTVWVIVPYREFKRIMKKHKEHDGSNLS